MRFLVRKAFWPRWFIAFTYGIARFYFRAEVRGLENIPSGPSVLVSNHSGGFKINPEVWILGAHYYQSVFSEEPIYGLMHDFAFRTPLVGRFMKRLGAIPASSKNALAYLRQGHRVILYPGGTWESCRPSRERDRVDFKGRTGFAQLAIDSRVPIVPVVAAGAHDGWYIFCRGNRIAKFLRLEKIFRIDCFPVGLAFPFGIVLGPMIPFLLLPRKIIIQVLEPILPGTDPDKFADYVTNVMQRKLDDLVSELPPLAVGGRPPESKDG